VARGNAEGYCHTALTRIFRESGGVAVAGCGALALALTR
jgi:hypothetical protein